MRTHVSVLVLMVELALMVGLLPTAIIAQVPRDTPPPSIQNARRERELRALVASGSATKETYLELADARMSFIRAGVALEDRALTLKPDYSDAMTYKSIMLRMQANLTTDAAEKAALFDEADALRNHVIELSRQQPSAPASFAGFTESFDQSMARLTPVRVGDSVSQPTKTRDESPTYPFQAQLDHVQGVVIIAALIDPSGAVANARILRSIPPLDEAALSAVSRWQFRPSLVNGAPVAVLTTVTVNFTLRDAR